MNTPDVQEFRTGMIKELLGKKIGMTQIFADNADFVGITALEVEPACILEKITYTKGVKAKVGYFKIPQRKVDKVKKPILGFFDKIGVSPYKIIKEVDLDNANAIEVKKEIGVDVFKKGDIVDVRAKSKGRGFQGGMKRHGWRGQPRTHGSTSHRRIGSSGSTTYPGRIIKGLRMPGHMGNSYTTVKNLKVIKVDSEKNILYLCGSVPGAQGAVVSIKRVNPVKKQSF